MERLGLGGAVLLALTSCRSADNLNDLMEPAGYENAHPSFRTGVGIDCPRNGAGQPTIGVKEGIGGMQFGGTTECFDTDGDGRIDFRRLKFGPQALGVVGDIQCVGADNQPFEGPKCEQLHN